MPKTYSAGDQLLATEYNQIVKVAGCYAASATGNDTYAITVSPAPTTYAAGDAFSFKADVGNTGPCSLNVNGLGDVTIKKLKSLDLATGDIVAGQIVDVVHDGTNFQMKSQLSTNPISSNGVFTKNLADANGSQTIAHGLGKIPTKVKFTAMYSENGGTQIIAFSIGTYNGSTTGTVAHYNNGSVFLSITDTTNVIRWINSSTEHNATVTFDATNITLSWTKINSPSGNLNVMWEAEA